MREMAKKLGVSPTYLSKVERDEMPPPVEDKVKAIAAILEQDPDELLALSGRVASDVNEIIINHPREMASVSSDHIRCNDKEASRRKEAEVILEPNNGTERER